MKLIEVELLIFCCGAGIFNLTVAGTDALIKGENPLLVIICCFGVVFLWIAFHGLMRQREKLMGDKN